MKYLKYHDNFNHCNYFEDFGEHFYFKNHFQKPLYYFLNKRVKAIKEWMSPDEYFNKISEGFGITVEETLDIVNDDIVNKYVQDMENGDKFPIGWYTPKSSSQEGRHRYSSAKKLGCKHVPVIRQEYITQEDLINFHNEHKDKTFDQLNSIFIDMGYSGISSLGFNDFQRFEDFYL